MDISWDDYFMTLAEAVAIKSHCYSQQFGSVLVTPDHDVLVTAYNGPPRGTKHCETRNPNGELICPRRLMGFKHGEGLQWCKAVHSEEGIVVQAARLGVSTKGNILYASCGIPCLNCTKVLINAGIIEVICLDTGEYSGNIGLKSKDLFVEAGVKLREIRVE